MGVSGHKTQGASGRGDKEQTASRARMFEDDSEEDEDGEGGVAAGEQTEEDDTDYRICKTPPQDNYDALLAWVHLQRRCAREWNYLIIGAATRIHVRAFSLLRAHSPAFLQSSNRRE